MVVMTWNMNRDESGRRVLNATWTPVAVPVPRESDEDIPVPVLQAS
jgi:hypothetical protein